MQLAVQEGRLECLKLMIDLGVPAGISLFHGMNLLHEVSKRLQIFLNHKACSLGFYRIVNELCKVPDIDINSITDYGDTGSWSLRFLSYFQALHLAVRIKSTAVLTALLGYGPDLSIKNSDGMTPAELAIALGEKDLAEMLASLPEKLSRLPRK